MTYERKCACGISERKNVVLHDTRVELMAEQRHLEELFDLEARKWKAECENAKLVCDSEKYDDLVSCLSSVGFDTSNKDNVHQLLKSLITGNVK